MSKETEKVVDLIINGDKAEALSAINDLVKEKISEDETFKKLEDEMSKYLQVTNKTEED